MNELREEISHILDLYTDDNTDAEHEHLLSLIMAAVANHT